jgi:hypothetical protein
MARILLSREYVYRELEKRHCSLTREYEATTLWETGSGVWFAVPHEGRDKKTAQDRLNEICDDVDKWNKFTGKKPL